MQRLGWDIIKQRAKEFAAEWHDETYEKAETQSFYNEFFAIFGVRRRAVASYEKRVGTLDKSRHGFIDLFWPGIPQSTNVGRFQYTGQAWLSEIGMYYYKARIYSPTLGRFLQTDPIGYGDGMNIYAYVGNDPVNKIDPSGLCGGGVADGSEIEVCGSRILPGNWAVFLNLFGGGGGGGGGSGGGDGPSLPPEQVPQKEKPEESMVEKLKECAKAQYGFGDGDTPTGLDFGRMVSELGALPIPKRWVGVPVIGNSSTVTNAVSLIPHKLGIRLNTGTQIFGSGRVFGVLGRANAVVGGAMLAWDAASIAICTARD